MSYQGQKRARHKAKGKRTSTKQGAELPKHLLGKNVLAAYYNDARLNILACLNDIRVKIGKKVLENDDQIFHALTDLGWTKAKPETASLLIAELRQRFPFLDVLTDAAPLKQKKQKPQQDRAAPLPQYYENHLKWLFELVNDLRNGLVHPTDAEAELTWATYKKLHFALAKIYDSSLRTVKQRFGHTTDEIKPFLRCGKKGIPKPASEFTFALCTDPRSREASSEKVKQSAIFHDFGYVLLCALFLEKSQSAELLSYFWESGYGKQWQDAKQRSTIRELLAVYRLRLPLQRLQSDNTPVAVTLDTLSELARCPRPLLDVLSPEDQQRFRGNLGDNAPEGQDTDNTWLFARSREDRFVPLLLRFLDFDKHNNRLRFALDLGQYYYNVRLKPADRFTDQQARVRRLGQKLLAYERLEVFENAEKPASWQQLEENYRQSLDDETQTAQADVTAIQPLPPYIVPTYPHYHYFTDKIGFRLAPNKHAESQAAYPDDLPVTGSTLPPQQQFSF